ncbi:OmpA family protein [Pedobacter insulae]|uniref:OmpA-OmpF porin, OOP family n=1 Tax=Pedobacter insulae TaxID=414048 RepID=A0A1I2YS87_9SPHI|nr:OmpA family protein [Pedobacter insulae]SFH28330.1 OmpA-OmpF porin, OOP family [Pedobacter insulae]
MNYSTLKKGLVASLVVLMGATSLVSAQDAPAPSSSAKVFGGRGQYRTWSLGVNAGILQPVVLLGGRNDFTNWGVNLGYGVSIRKQLGHAFGLEGNIMRGKISGSNEDAAGGVQNGIASFETKFGYAADLRGVINVATVDFLSRENSVNFILNAGYGLLAYEPTVTAGNGTSTTQKPLDGDKYYHGAYIPVGAGVKFKISDNVSFNLNYTMSFVDDFNVNGVQAGSSITSNFDKFSYTSAGLEFSLGSKAKPNLDWVNPLALMYDELKDPSLRQEVEALKNRVSNVEKSIEDLKKDSDGDGVADQFDKCPGTPAGTAVDGSGCPLPVPAPVTATETSTASGWETIQFEFNSSVLKTEAYPILDKLSSTLRENGGKITAKGYASSEGTAAYNLKLSKDRANSVKTYLVNSGVNSSQVTAKGFGEANPIASNDTEEGRIQNRRVETSRN